MKKHEEGAPAPDRMRRPATAAARFLKPVQNTENGGKRNRSVAQFLLGDVATIRIAGKAAQIGGAQ